MKKIATIIAIMAFALSTFACGNKKKVNQLQKQVSERDQKINMLKSEITILNEDLTKANKQLTKSKKDNKALRKKVASLRRQIDDKETEILNLQSLNKMQALALKRKKRALWRLNLRIDNLYTGQLNAREVIKVHESKIARQHLAMKKFKQVHKQALARHKKELRNARSPIILELP